MAAFTGLVTPWGQEHGRALLQPARRRPCQQPCTEKPSLPSSAVAGFVMLLAHSRTCRQATPAATRLRVPVLPSVEDPNFKVQNEARAEKNVLMLVDASGLLHAYYHTQLGSYRLHGQALDQKINRVLGYFTTKLHSFRRELNPSHMAVLLDHEDNRAERLLFLNTYKANRSSQPEALKTLIKRAPEACEAAGIAWRWSAGYEADDLVATYCVEARKDSVVNIYSADKDLVQLVDDDVYVLSMGGCSVNTRHTVDSYLSEHKIHPRRVVDVIAMTGDISDNIPGIDGIGPVKAQALIQHFGPLPSILKGVESGELPGKVCGQNINAKDVDNLRKSGEQALYYRDNLIKLKMVPGIDASSFREDFRIKRKTRTHSLKAANA